MTALMVAAALAALVGLVVLLADRVGAVETHTISRGEMTPQMAAAVDEDPALALAEQERWAA